MRALEGIKSPEAMAFDGSHIWVADGMDNSVTAFQS